MFSSREALFEHIHKNHFFNKNDKGYTLLNLIIPFIIFSRLFHDCFIFFLFHIQAGYSKHHSRCPAKGAAQMAKQT